MDIKSFILKNWKEIVLFVICWSIGFYTLRVSAVLIDLDKPKEIHPTLLIFFFFSIGMILMPFLKSLKIGKMLELEREVNQTKQELKETKNELQQSISIALTTISTSINSLNNSVNITIPGVEEMRKEVEKLQNEDEPATKHKLEEELDEIISNDGDLNIALARARMEIERLMREILNKPTSLAKYASQNTKYMTLHKLFRTLVVEHSDFRKYEHSFKYVQSICNAAIHGQKVSYAQAEEALHLSIILITELKKLNENVK